jgi:hypothetical protein
VRNASPGERLDVRRNIVRGISGARREQRAMRGTCGGVGHEGVGWTREARGVGVQGQAGLSRLAGRTLSEKHYRCKT